MRMTAAFVAEGVAIVLVTSSVVHSPTRAAETIAELRRLLGCSDVILAHQSGTRMHYRGTPTLVRELKKAPWDVLPWREFSVN